MEAFSPRRSKFRLDIKVEFSTEEEVKELMNNVLTLLFKKNVTRKVDTNYRFELQDLEQSKEDLVDYRFERALIDGKEKVLMIIPSKMNKE